MILRSLPESYNALTTALESRNDDELTLQLIRPKLIDESKKEKYIGNQEIAMKAGTSNSYEKRCYFCNQAGHLKKKCRKFLNQKKNENNSNKSNNYQQSARQVRNDADKTSSKEFTIMVKENSTVVKGWILDSGATSHMCKEKEIFMELQDSSILSVTLADGKEVPVKGIGKLKLKTVDEYGNYVDLNMTRVLFVPDLESNLMSVSKLVSSNVALNFDRSGCKLMLNGNIIGVVDRFGDLFKLRLAQNRACVAKSGHLFNCQHIWHRRLGHRDPTVIGDILKKNLATGLNAIDCGINEPCVYCMKGKMSRAPFPKKSIKKSNKPLDLVHTDVGCVLNPESPSGTKYFLTIIDDYSRYIDIYFMKNKSETAGCIKQYVRKTQNQFGAKIKKIRSDQGGEFSSKELMEFYKAEGIQAQFTAGYSPQQNGVAERRNRHLIEMARCMLLDGGMEKCYWPEAVNTAAYLQNILPSHSIEKTPHELWFGEKPKMDHLKVFGCKAEVHIPKEKRTKLSDKSETLIFVGYSANHKAYRFLNLETNQITISRDAFFLENNSEKDNTVKVTSSSENNMIFLEPLSTKKNVDSDDEDFLGFDVATEAANVRRSERIKVLSKPDYRENAEIVIEKERDPLTFKEAISSKAADKWKMAMDSEMASISENKTWELVSLPPGKSVIGSKWVFKQKEDENEKIVRYKARLVALGCSQKYGRDYDEVFAPVVRQATFRTLLTIASKRNLEVQHVDVKTAYLYGELSEYVYMKQPPGYENENKNLVCRLLKSIYGLKQAAYVWNKKIDDVFKKMEFTQSSADPCLYIRTKNGKSSYILVFVDDFILACEDKVIYQEIIEGLKKNFKISELGEIKFFLGIQVQKIDGVYVLNQTLYINKLLERFNLTEAKISKIPMDPGYLQQKEEEVFSNKDIYQSLIGGLLYVSVNTRPDIAVTASILGRKVTNPSVADWTEAKRVLKYLKGTKDFGLFLEPNEIILECYVDSDWAGDIRDRKSNSGYLFKLGNSLIEWKSRKQQCVSLSSTEAEYIALAECCQELLWICKLMVAFDVQVKHPIKVNEDNQSCIKIAEKDKFERRSKHIDTKFNYVKDLIKMEKIKLVYCSTSEMLADVLTKPLQSVKIQYFRSKIGIRQIRIEKEC
jgi:hypothetical protein